MSYRRRPSPLHSAGAGAGALFCLALGLAALMIANPIVLGALGLTVLGAAAGAGVGREVARTVRYTLPFALIIAVLNALITRNGLTVILRLGEVPLIGQTDVTLEAAVYGLVLGLRAVVLITCGALYTAAVDPDEMLALLRPLSFRSALTATLATRMVPVLLRDSSRLAEAQRCRPGPAPSRATLMRAVTAGMLDRALDVAAVLEVRGYGAAGRPRRRPRHWNRHDLAFAAAAGVIVGLAALAGPLGQAGFTAYPALHVAAGPAVLGLTAALLVAVLVPFADRRGIGP
ncbi:MAG TPA: energy-coupling factor transporter transmembrane component T [Solirubrobacteraceae bacterium]